MPIITINNKQIEVPADITLIQACELAGVEIPRFCYHERLAVAGNCRMCLVEVEGGAPKPVASCAIPVVDGMKVKTNSEMVKKAREGVMEFLLANHPLDCPICDQGGECDLQDQSYFYGRDSGRYNEQRRAVKEKEMGPLVKTSMNRCIHCTRCVRFITDVAGVAELGAVGRGEDMEITTYLQKALTSELSGNIIDLCPVGALTSKPYAFKARPWELKKTATIDVMDAVGSNIRVDSRGLEVMRILPRLNEEINEEWISDKTRFCYDGLKYQRLDRAYIKKDGKLTPCTVAEANNFIAEKLSGLKGDEIAALAGGLANVEEIMALKLLMSKLGSDNIDCRPFGSKIRSDDRTSYIFNTTIAGIEYADSCLIIGCNPRLDAPVLNARIRKRYLSGQMSIAAIGTDADLTYHYTKLSDDVKSLQEILDGSSPYCKILEKSQNPMIIIGVDLMNRDDSSSLLELIKKIAEKYKIVRNDWNGFNMLHKDAGLVGALDIGFVSKNNHTNFATIMDRAERGQIRAIYLLGFDDEHVSKLQDCFVIYHGSHGERGAAVADVILPAAAYTEQEATYVNTEGRIQRTTPVMLPFGDASEGWKVIHQLAMALEIDLGFANAEQLRNLMSQNSAIFTASQGSIIKNSWIVSSSGNLKIDEAKPISVAKTNFYKTNIIARCSRILAVCNNMTDQDISDATG